MMTITAERTLEIDEELCICFIDWQKAFDRVNWTKLMQILKRTGINWCERRLISKLYMDQGVKVRLDRGETRSVQIGRGVRQGRCLSPILFNLYSILDLNLRKKLVKCYIWSMAWTIRAADQKYLESFEMWCWRRMEKISWTEM